MQFAPKSRSFIGCSEAEFCKPEEAKVVVVPFGLEESVSYGGGARLGPEAIIKASQQLELFDEEFWCEPYKKYGAATLKKFPIKKYLNQAIQQIKKITGDLLARYKFPLILGGEHSLTSGAVQAAVSRFGKISILHFDAHADLRDAYQGEKFSHASAMRRCLDDERVSLVSVGIRSISAEEIPFLEANSRRIKIFWAKDKAQWKIPEILKSLGNNPVYLSFDLDAFDSSLMPATGTPEPGGLFWDEALAIIRAACQKKKIVGADVVELAPIRKLHAPDFLAAKLVYKILNYVFQKS